MRSDEQTSRRLKLQHLNVFLAVAQTSSMAKAAKQLGITQPVVSRTIGALEETLGVRLFDRNPAGVELTQYGSALLKRSASVFDDLCASVGDIKLLADPSAGELRIGANDVQAGFIATVIERMRQEYSRMTFTVTNGTILGLIGHELRERRIDLVLGLLPEHPLDHDLEMTALYNCWPNAIVSKQHHLARRKKLALTDLIHEPWCASVPGNPGGESFARVFRAHGLPLPQTVVATSSERLRMRLVEGGRLIGMVGQAFLRFNPLPAWLHVLPLELRAPPWPIGAITLKNRTISPAAQRFITAAREVAGPIGRNGAEARTDAVVGVV